MSSIRADARQLPIADSVVHCCVTSPPYWGLRDYGVSQQLGLEATPGAYVTALVEVFREVRRVLRDDGTAWLNLGDSYTSGGRDRRDHDRKLPARTLDYRAPTPNGLKAKDLVGIPWRVAFALQADGWYLRSDIIWAKPNPMPESVTDRPTRSHEYLFLLTKSAKYYYNAKAIAERPSKVGTIAHLAVQQASFQPLAIGEVLVDPVFIGGKNETTGNRRYVGFNARWDSYKSELVTRNRRDVWVIPPQPYNGAHFATMPEALVEPCILAGCPMGGLVLDPFIGSGTVGAVAERLSRRWVGVDLNYQHLAAERTAQRGLMFAEAVS